MEQVLVTAVKLWLYGMVAVLVIVTGGTHRIVAPVVPEGNVSQEEMGCIRK